MPTILKKTLTHDGDISDEFISVFLQKNGFWREEYDDFFIETKEFKKKYSKLSKTKKKKFSDDYKEILRVLETGDGEIWFEVD